ncbi:MAG TPA: hypothetical protein VLL52_05315 [Anaerolineae bacterium]|nr:hypothetical protein [Anaerolineae bacterium]
MMTDLDSLREKSARTTSVFEDMEESGGSNPLSGGSGYTPVQMVVIGLLVLANIIAFFVGLYVLFGM